jgi:1-phosphofructokinase family hexose kinase
MSNYGLLAVSVNTALDTYYRTDRVRLDSVNRVEHLRSAPGGKAINLARAYQRLGGCPLVAGIAGGSTGYEIETGLRHEGIAGEFIHAEAESRRTMTVVDGSSTTVFLEAGGQIDSQDFDDLAALVASRAPACSTVVIAGSVPPTAPAGYLATLVRMIRRVSSARIALDATGEPLRSAAREGVDLIKVNTQEFAAAFDSDPGDFTQVRGVFDALRKTGLSTLAITNGADGALVLDSADCFSVRAPVDSVVSSVGAGDAFLAGLLWGLHSGSSTQESFRLAAAAGAAATQVVGAGFIDPALVQRLISRTECMPVESFFAEVRP